MPDDKHDLDDFAPPLERVERRMDLMAQQIAYLQGIMRGAGQVLFCVSMAVYDVWHWLH